MVVETALYCGDQDYVVVKENIFNNDNYFEYVRYVDSIVGNQILNVENKSAITITDGNTFIANNYIHTKGQLESKAIYLSSNSSLSGTVIAHNSIENSGTAVPLATAST